MTSRKSVCLGKDRMSRAGSDLQVSTPDHSVACERLVKRHSCMTPPPAVQRQHTRHPTTTSAPTNRTNRHSDILCTDTSDIGICASSSVRRSFSSGTNFLDNRYSALDQDIVDSRGKRCQVRLCVCIYAILYFSANNNIS